MKPDRTRPIWTILATILFAAAGTLWSDGLNDNEVEFTGAISSVVVNGEGVGTLFIRLDDYDLRVVVNAHTEITGLDGDPIAMSDLKPEARVTITGKYSASGILAARIRLEESPDNDFRVRGKIKSVETSSSQTVVTLQAIDVVVNADTKIEDGSASLTASSLVPGLWVRIEGTITTAGWVASSVRIQSSEKKKEQVRFEGTVVSVADDALQIAVEGLPGNVTKVILEAKTKIRGELSPGVAVYVIGTLNPDLTVTAREVRVLQAIEIKPDEKKLKVGESATLIVKLRQSAAEDVSVSLKVEDASVAGLSVPGVTIPKGSSTAEFIVTGGPNTGTTEVTAEALGQKATARIKVGEVSEGENENHAGAASIVFAPEQIKMGLNAKREVVLLIKPPQKKAVSVELAASKGLVKVLALTEMGNGAAAFKVTIQSAGVAGSDSVVATLPASLGGAKAELLVVVTAASTDSSNKPKAQIDFSPREVKLAVGESLEASLISSRSYDTDVTISLAAAKGHGTIEFPPSVILAAGTKSVRVAVKGISEGKAGLTAAMPAEYGGDTASLGVQVKKK